jgi:hypothetical protein
VYYFQKQVIEEDDGEGEEIKEVENEELSMVDIESPRN